MRLKIFLIAFLISLPFWWGINILEENLKDFLFWLQIAENPQILTAHLNQQRLEEKLRSMKPLRDGEVEDLKIDASSSISFLVDFQGKEKVLFQKNSNVKLPIASLTKLMTAHIVLENYDLSEIIEVSKEAVLQKTEFGKLKIGEIFRTGDLLYPLLMESSNDAAYALAVDYSEINEETFVELMNLEAKNLNLENTYFINPTGLDPDSLQDSVSYSTVQDLVKLTKFLLKKQPLIWEILGTREFDLYAPDGVYHHKLKNNNELLEKSTSWQEKIIGGKTGWTLRSQGCLLLVLRAPKPQSFLINIILGSQDRFKEMEKLIDWVYEAHKW